MKYQEGDLENLIKKLKEAGILINEIANRIGMTRSALNTIRVSTVLSKRKRIQKLIEEEFKEELSKFDHQEDLPISKENLKSEIERLKKENSDLIQIIKNLTS